MADEDLIVTPRLRLVPLGPDHVDLLASHWNHPQINAALFGGELLPPEILEEQLEISELDFESDGFGLWAIEVGDVPCVGVVGLRQAVWRNGIELVFSIEPAWWGHGYASESTKAVVARAINEIELREVVAIAKPQDHPALRVLAKAGMRPVGEARIGSDRRAVFVVRHPIR